MLWVRCPWIAGTSRHLSVVPCWSRKSRYLRANDGHRRSPRPPLRSTRSPSSDTIFPGTRWVPSAGFEPAHTAPEADALSPELRGRAIGQASGAGLGARTAAVPTGPESAGWAIPTGASVRRPQWPDHGRPPLSCSSDRLQPAFERVGSARRRRPRVVGRSSERADAQANGALPLARRLGRNPARWAAVVAEAAGDLVGVATVEIAGPGFLNLHVDPAFLGAAWPPSRPTTASASPLGRPARVRGRLLGAQRRQGDARRPPAHHGDRRRSLRVLEALGHASSARTTSATGARSSAC